MSRAVGCWVVAFSPSSGKELHRAPWTADAEMDEYEVASRLAKDLGRMIEVSKDGVVPNNRGDIRVEFRSDPDCMNTALRGESFYFAIALEDEDLPNAVIL